MSHSHSHSPNEQESVEELEARHFRSIVEVFTQYESYSLSANNRRRKDFYKLPLAHQKLLEELGWRKRLEEVDNRIELNAAFLRDVVDNPDIFAVYEEEGGAVRDTQQGGFGHDHVNQGGEASLGRPSLFHDAPPHSMLFHGHGHGPETATHASHSASPAAGGHHIGSPAQKSPRATLFHDPPTTVTQDTTSSLEGPTLQVPSEQERGRGERASGSPSGSPNVGSPTPSDDVHEDDDHPYAQIRREHLHPHPHPHPHDHAHGGRSSSHSHSHSRRSSLRSKNKNKVSDFDMDKLRSTLKQFSRDWSEEGKEERDSCYKPMLDALLDHFSDVDVDQRMNFRVLVPGAGLGRLAWDVAALGFASQGNEFSHFMLLSSYFILNRTEQKNQHTIYPFIHSFSNVPSTEAMLRAIKIPDVLPSDLPEDSDFSLVAGDFEEIYGVTDEDALRDESSSGKEPQSGRWHAVMTCFFIDTAKDIVNYLKIIHRVLATGGVWINLGPLLWHFENNTTGDPSIELDLEEVKELSRMIGFEITNERTIPTTYTGNPESMLRHEYQAAFWVAKKI